MGSPRISFSGFCVAGLSAVYWICAGMRAATLPFSFDELTSWRLARLPSVGAMWSALHRGVDQQLIFPPLCIRFSHWLFGYGHLATRLSALIGFWIMLMGLYFFLQRRLPVRFALAGMLFPTLTFAWQYAYEARAYGIILGCAAVALAAWQSAADSVRRPLSLILITVSLAVALACHMGAVILATPLGLGEIVRSMHRRRIDLAIWIAFAAAAPVVLMYPAMLAPTRDWDFGGLRPTISEMASFYSVVLRASIAPLLAAGIIAYALGRGEKPQPVSPHPLPPHEVAALLGLVVSPLVFLFAGLVKSNVLFFPRYGLPAVLGIAGWLAILLFRGTGGNRRTAAVIVIVLSAWLAIGKGREAMASNYPPNLQFLEDNDVLMGGLADGRTVVTTDANSLSTSDFYLPAEAAGRLFYVIDRPAARPYLFQDIVDHLVRHGAESFPLRTHVESWSTFSARNREFLLHSNEPHGQWLYAMLLRENWRMVLIKRRGGQFLYEVSAGRGAASP